MIRAVLAAALCAAAIPASASCVGMGAGDRWTGHDKGMHIRAGAAIGAAGTLIFRDPQAGIVLGSVMAVAKEAADAGRVNHTCSAKDAIATVIGAALGSYAVGWIITPNSINFHKEF